MKRVLLSMLLAALVLPVTAQSVASRGSKAVRVQSTGDTLTYTTVYHDGKHIARTLDGYTLWHTEDGDIVYAIRNTDRQLVASTVLATDRRQSEEEQQLLKSLDKGLLPDIPLLTTGSLLGGSYFKHEATESDSLLVILVQFQDEQFSNPWETFDDLFNDPNYNNGTGSFRRYYYDQSGGRFDVGVRVVGPVTLPHNKSYYNQTSWLGTNISSLISSALADIDGAVDFSHYDNDNNGVVDGLLLYYAGNRPASNSEGLWPHRSEVDGIGARDGKSFSDYIIFDEGLHEPVIGTICHEFGHLLGLPDLYDVAHNGTDHQEGRTPGYFSLMASGNYNGGGNLPPNLSVLEKSLLGWGAQFDTLVEGDSINMRAIGTANDRAWYLSIDGNEFFAFEARNGNDHWDSGLGIGEGGLVVYHGKESKLNTQYNNVINCTVGDEGWYVVNYNVSSFTPYSADKPMKNDSTQLDSVWITAIRWTSDSTMAFAYSKTRPNQTFVEADYLSQRDYSDEGFTGRGTIYAGTEGFIAKGIVYATSGEECNMQQGTVVHDTTMSDTVNIRVSVHGLPQGTYYYRTFVTNSDGSNTLSYQIQKVTLKKVGLRGVYLLRYNSYHQSYIVDMEIHAPCTKYLFWEYMNEEYVRNYPEWLRDTTLASIYDVSGSNAQSVSVNDNGELQFGVFAITADGDTTAYLYYFDTTEVVEVTEQYYWSKYRDSVADNVWTRQINMDVEDSLFLVKMSNAELKEIVRYYHREMYFSVDTLYNYDETVGDIVPVADTTNEWWWTLANDYSYSIYNYIRQNYQCLPVSRGYNISPLIPGEGSDSVVVMLRLEPYGIAKTEVLVDIRPDTVPLGLAEVETFYLGDDLSLLYYDTIFTVYPNNYTDYYYMIYGTPAGLAAIGITDSASAVAYCTAHQSSLTRYSTFGRLSFEYSLAEHYNTIGPLEADSTMLMYIIPYNCADEMGIVLYQQFHIYGKAIEVTPAGNGNSDWWRIYNGQLTWGWRYEDNNGFIENYAAAILPAGTIDSLRQTMTVGNAMLHLSAQGKLRNYGYSLSHLPSNWPEQQGNSYYTYGDTITGLELNRSYEICIWIVTYDGDTIMERTEFSTAGVTIVGEQAQINQLSHNYSSWDVSHYYYIKTNDATAYYHILFGEEGQLADMGISDIRTAAEYSHQHTTTLPKFTQHRLMTYFTSGNDYSGNDMWGLIHYRYINRSLSADSTYRVYVIPYNATDWQGQCMFVRFSGDPQNITYEDVDAYMLPISNITTTTATLNGKLIDHGGSEAFMTVAFRCQANADFRYISLPYTGDSIYSVVVDSLIPNTTYYVYFGTVNSCSSTITFTTEACTIQTVIDTTICYHAYYGNHWYNEDTQLTYNYTTAGGCDSIEIVNIHVLPQRIRRDTIDLCYGEEYEGSPRYSSFTVTNNITEEGQCDSTESIRMNVLPANNSTFTDTLHNGSYTWNGVQYTESGNYTQVFTDSHGCDSTVTLQLKAEPAHNGLSEVDIDGIHIYNADGYIVAEGVEEKTISIYDAVGRKLTTQRGNLRYEVPDSGVYMIRIEGLPARRIVVAK